MNRIITSTLFAGCLASVVVVAGCGDDDEEEDPCANARGQSDISCADGVCTVEPGDYIGDLSFSADNDYLLNGQVFVGVDRESTCTGVLTVAAGTEVLGAQNSYLAIRPGSRIEANGTAASPIVFTSAAASPSRGDWGGLVISGNATVNCGGAGVTCDGEGATGAYGGTDDTDNSGTLRYVRVEYGGFKINALDELNGVAFQGAGSGTTVDHLHVHKSDDDGVEYFGGTANIKHLLITGIGDDGLDWTFGWRGKAQYVIIQHHSPGDNRGIEADNNEDNNDATPRSDPIISNISIIGATDTSTTSDGEDDGVVLRRGTAAQLWNAIIYNWETGLDIDSPATFDQVDAGELVMANSIVFGNTKQFSDGEEEDPSDTAVSTAFLTTWSNNSEEDPGFSADVLDVTNPDFVPTAAAATSGGSQPPNDSFFDNVTFKGGADEAWYSWTEFN